MGKTRSQAVVLDAGALIAFERGDPRLRALFREAVRVGARLVIPAAVVLIARRKRATVLTSDVEDLRRLDPTLQLERV